MPELPDISAYITALESRIVGEPIEHVRLATPFLLRTVEPPIASVEGRGVRELRRIGKRIVIGVEPDLWLVLHLMIAKAEINWRLSIFRMALWCSQKPVPGAAFSARAERRGESASGKSCLPQRALRFNAG